MALPANATVTITRALHTITKHATAAHHVAHHATTTWPKLHINLTPSFSGNPLLIAGVAVMLIGIILIPIVLKLGKGRGRSINAARLIRAVTDPTVDAVGLIFDADTGSSRIVALKAVENMYFSLDPPATIVIRNPHATPMMIEGKPLIVVHATGKIGAQVDVPTLTTLGLARVAIDDPAWNDTVTPSKALDELINKLSVELGKRKGVINVTPSMKLGFEMHMPPVIKAAISQQLASSYMLALGITNFASAVESIASQISIAKGQAEFLKMSGYAKLLMIVGIIVFLAFLGMYFLHLAAPHP